MLSLFAEEGEGWIAVGVWSGSSVLLGGELPSNLST